jgi:hypothetical protein
MLEPLQRMEQICMTDQKALVVGFISRCPPVQWIDWWLHFQSRPAGERLYAALFNDVGETRDLSAPRVRQQVVDCVLGDGELFDFVHTQAAAMVSAVVEQLISPQPVKTRVVDTRSGPSFRYRCGLVPGDQVYLRRDFPVIDSRGKQVGIHAKGEIWRVSAPGSQEGVLWLRTPSGDAHTWDDDATVFDTFERAETTGPA